RRRHTRFSRDWSSDVCSSDLPTLPTSKVKVVVRVPKGRKGTPNSSTFGSPSTFTPVSIVMVGTSATFMDARTLIVLSGLPSPSRSEERRVGKEDRRLQAERDK